jgi:Holliday junction resolvasome RuvABC endonuclease subunit
LNFRSLGIDPGTSNPGAAIAGRDPRGWRLIRSPVLQSLDDLLTFLETVEPGDVHCVCCEDLSWIGAAGAAMAHGNKSAEIVRAVGAAQSLAHRLRVPFVQVRPQSYRARIAGNRRASKAQVRTAVRRFVRGVPDVFGLNRSDALAIALAGAAEPGARIPRGRGRV